MAIRRWQDIHSEISSGIRARHLQTDVASAMFFAPEEPQSRPRELLHEFQFDQAPILSDGRMIGYVLRTELTDSSDR